MNFKYFLLIITLKNIYCYNPKRHVTPISSMSNFKNLNSKADPVIPARYKITSTTNYNDPAKAQSFPAEYFPEVEYPESIVESSKPFYISSSPFSKDVKSTFNSLIAKGNSKAKTTTDYSWTQNVKSKDKTTATVQKVGVNEITNTKGNEINSSDKNINETLCEDITNVDVKDDAPVDKIPYFDSDQLFANLTSIEQYAECEDKDYVVEFINELDELMKNLTNTETTEPNDGEILTNAGKPECNEGNNTNMQTSESEHLNEFKLSSDMTLNNNDSIIELNGDSFLEEEDPVRIRLPLFKDTLTNVTSSLNEYINNDTSVEDVQNDLCTVGPFTNETDTSCTES